MHEGFFVIIVDISQKKRNARVLHLANRYPCIPTDFVSETQGRDQYISRSRYRIGRHEENGEFVHP